MRTRFGGSRRPRSVWIALASGICGTVLVALLVLIPVTGLVTGSLGAEWFVDIPVGGITLVVVAGYLLVAGLLALIIRTRHGAVGWVLSTAAVLVALGVSLYPAVAVASAATERVGDIIPFVTRWIEEGAELLR